MASDNTTDIKTLAHSLKSELASMGHDVPLGHVLETLSHVHGSRDWNTLKALADKGAVAAATASAVTQAADSVQEMAAWIGTFQVRPLRIWRMFPTEGGGRLESRFGLAKEERTFSFAGNVLDAGFALATKTGMKGFVYEAGRAWRCAPGLAEPQEVFTLNDRRACMAALIGRRNKNGHVLVGFAVEDDPGAYPVPNYNYGETVQEAEANVLAFNESRGVTPDEAHYIILTTMSPEGVERP